MIWASKLCRVVKSWIRAREARIAIELFDSNDSSITHSPTLANGVQLHMQSLFQDIVQPIFTFIPSKFQSMAIFYEGLLTIVGQPFTAQITISSPSAGCTQSFNFRAGVVPCDAIPFSGLAAHLTTRCREEIRPKSHACRYRTKCDARDRSKAA